MSTKDEIPASSFILEPLLVASLLTAGALLNRRRGNEIQQVNNLVESHEYKIAEGEDHNAATGPRVEGSGANKRMRFLWTTMRIPDNVAWRLNFFSRFLNMFPFVMEIWYWLLTYWSYQLARALQAVTMGDNTRSLSQDHSLWLLGIESALGLDMELGLQKFVIKHDALLWFFNKTYAMVHIPATITFFGYAFRYFPAPSFQAVRRTLVLSNFFAFIIFSSWPCMPPRLLPKEYGYIDTLHAGKAASIWTTNKFQNQLAAFPSLHFGYSFVLGVAMIVYSPHRFMRILAPAYPILILLVIMATANHYFLDAVGGFFVTILAYRVNRLLLNLRPIEEWAFWLVRTERPMDKAKYESVLSRQTMGERDGANRPLMADSA